MLAPLVASWNHTFRNPLTGLPVPTVGLSIEDATDRLRVHGGFIEPVYELPAPRHIPLDDLPLTAAPLGAPSVRGALDGSSPERPAASYPVAVAYRDWAAAEALKGLVEA